MGPSLARDCHGTAGLGSRRRIGVILQQNRAECGNDPRATFTKLGVEIKLQFFAI
jgi:hypothetical protein